MTDKAKLDAIRAEIHRLVDVRGYDREMANDLFTFMDSLPNEPVIESNEQLAETYLVVFDKKFPILPTLKGKQLADYKNFLNKCQQIFGLKEWGIRPTQAKLFEKLSLLWAAWGVEHLQGVGRQDKKEQDIPVSEDLEEALTREWQGYNDRGAATVDALEDNTQELAFAKGFYRGAEWQKEQMEKEYSDLNKGIVSAKGVAVYMAYETGKKEVIGKVRSILNKVAYKNDSLDVNGDYCEQPYVELDNEFKKLLKED